MLEMLDMTSDDPLSIAVSKYEAIKARAKASRTDSRAGLAARNTIISKIMNIVIAITLIILPRNRR